MQNGETTGIGKEGKGQSSITQTVDVGNVIYSLDDKGNWTYIEKALKADTLYGRKETATYQDKAELKVLEAVENKSKQEFKDSLHTTVLEIAQYLKSLIK